MKYLGSILLIGFVSLAVFGVFGMHAQADMNMRGHDMPTSNCVGATVNGTDCPKQADPIDYLTFHFDAFRSFSLATFGESVMGAFLLLAFAALLFVGLAFFKPHLFEPPQLAFSRQRFGDPFSPPQKQELARWLALHENSPAVF